MTEKHISRRELAGVATVAVALFVWALAPATPSLAYQSLMLVSGVAAGGAVIKGLAQ